MTRAELWLSTDGGKTWAPRAMLSEAPYHGDSEVGLVEVEPGQLWAVTRSGFAGGKLGQPSRLFRSSDGGHTWDGPFPTGIQGQTMTPVWLGDDRYLIVYNKRFGDQSVQMCLVRASGSSWTIDFEGTLFDGRAKLELSDEISSQEQIGLIKFGYPMGMRLDDSTMLTVHWCEEDGVCGIRWTRLHVDW